MSSKRIEFCDTAAYFFVVVITEIENQCKTNAAPRPRDSPSNFNRCSVAVVDAYIYPSGMQLWRYDSALFTVFMNNPKNTYSSVRWLCCIITITVKKNPWSAGRVEWVNSRCNAIGAKSINFFQGLNRFILFLREEHGRRIILIKLWRSDYLLLVIIYPNNK